VLGATPRPRLLPRRHGGLRGAEPDLRRRDDAEAPRHPGPTGSGLRYGPRAASSGPVGGRPEGVRRREEAEERRRPRAPGFKDGRSWVDVRSTTSTSTSRRSPARISPPRTSHLARDRARRGRARRLRRAAGSKTARERAIAARSKEVAYYLGNTPAVCRASYIRPTGLLTATATGITIGGALERLGDVDLGEPPRWGGCEEAVLDLLERVGVARLEKLRRRPG
jgi:hypothetical protein